MPTERNRQKDDRSLVGGSITNPYGFYPQQRSVGTIVDTTDIVGNFRGNNPFNLKRDFYDTAFLNGNWPPGGPHTWFAVNYPLSLNNSPPDPDTHFGVPSSLELASWHTELAAKTNPSSQHVSLPTMAAEAPGYRDLANSIRQFGRQQIAAKAGSAYLTYRWVVKPLVSDVKGMLDFASVVEKRMKELESIRDNGGGSKRASLAFETFSTSHTEIVESFADLIYANVETTYTRRVWGSTHWVPLYPDYIPKNRKDLREKVEFALAGMNKDGLTAAAWEAIPWSWLIDWFAGVGSLLEAKANAFGLEQRSSCIMVHDRAVRKFTLQPGSWQSWLTASTNSFSVSTERKRRFPISDFAPYIPPFSPILKGKHLSILAALIASRRSRS